MKSIFAVLIVMTTAAHADDRATAETYFRAGSKAYAAQNFSAAATDFDEAYRAMALPEIAFSAAQAYRRLYRVDPKPQYVRRAVELYRVYLDKVKSGGRVGDAADSLGELERELDRLKISVAPAAPEAEHTRLGVNITIADQRIDTAALHEITDGTGEIATVTKGLVATLDGKPLEPFALVDVAAGEHAFTVAADGYVPVEKTAKAVPGRSQLIEIELRPKPATIGVKTEPDAQISIDGRAVATAPTTPLEVAAGKHLLAITHRGREPYGRELMAMRGQTLTVTAPLVMASRRRAVPWVAAGAGVLAAGALTTMIVALERDSHAGDLRAQIAAGNRPPSDADAYDQTVASRDHFVTATWILGGAALAAGATSALLYLFDSPSTEGVHVVPLAGGAAIAGRF